MNSNPNDRTTNDDGARPHSQPDKKPPKTCEQNDTHMRSGHALGLEGCKHLQGDGAFAVLAPTDGHQAR